MTAFENRAKLGISNYYTSFNKGKIQSFESLKGKYGLNQSDFYRYLQVRHYIECNIKPEIFKFAETGIIKVFLSVCKAQSCNKIISKLYNGFL